jgi:acyl carrier protein
MSRALGEARALLGEALGLPAEALPDDSDMAGTEAWDSLAHLRLVLGLEARLGRELTSETIVALASLQDIAALLDGVA